ncbi:hypothetical protein ACTHPH_18095 [Paenibacillus pasadenensis]
MSARTFGLWAAGLFLAGLAARLLLGLYTNGYVGDQMYFIRWMQGAMEHGVRLSYVHADMQNYPPVFIAILEGYGHVLNALGLEIKTAHLTSKALPILFDLLAMAILPLVLRRRLSRRSQLLLLGALALNPALLADGAIWGQIDVFHSLLMALGVLALVGQPFLAGALLGIALLSKFQAIVIAPVIGAYALRRMLRRDFAHPLLLAAGFLAPLALTAACFSANGTLDDMVQAAYLSATDMYPQLSLNAFNLWYHLFTDPSLNDTTTLAAGMSYKTFGFLLLGLACAFVAAYVLLLKQLRTVHLLMASAFINLAFFMLPTEIHERYGVPAMLFLVLVPFLMGRETTSAFDTTASPRIVLVPEPAAGTGSPHPLRRWTPRRLWSFAAGWFTLSTALNIWMVLNGGMGGKWLGGRSATSRGFAERSHGGSDGSGGLGRSGFDGSEGFGNGGFDGRGRAAAESGQPWRDASAGGWRDDSPGSAFSGGFGSGSLVGWEHALAVALSAANLALLLGLAALMLLQFKQKERPRT